MSRKRVGNNDKFLQQRCCKGFKLGFCVCVCSPSQGQARGVINTTKSMVYQKQPQPFLWNLSALWAFYL